MTAPVDELAERLRPWVSEAVYDFAELVALARLAEQSNGRYYRKWARAQTKAEQYREALAKIEHWMRGYDLGTNENAVWQIAAAALAASEGGEDG